eukprot:augustus_masked-scaffold_2-processed-gene-17.45-mRNA-1 protein AED:1.00 eAED:1.00 QI:0/-1/0/0/-1/1/1/0/381
MENEEMENLLQLCLRACETVAPLINKIYQYNKSSVGSSVAVKKADSSAFTIADGLVQFFLKESFLGVTKKEGDQVLFNEIIGEENVDVLLDSSPFSIDGIEVPKQFEEEIKRVQNEISRISIPYEKEKLENYKVFIDPIDGTQEFVNGLGDQCTTLIGFSNAKTLKSEAGIIYSPMTGIYALGTINGHYETNVAPLKMENDAEEKKSVFLTTNGSISPFLETLISDLNCIRVKQGGCGNKVLRLIAYSLGEVDAMYIQDRGVSRWDSCAPEAVLTAFDGVFYTLSSVFSSDSAGGYKYDTNKKTFVDSISTKPVFSKYNIKSIEELDKLNGKPITKTCIDKVKPYSNLEGLCAIKTKDKQDTERIIAIVTLLSTMTRPNFC